MHIGKQQQGQVDPSGESNAMSAPNATVTVSPPTATFSPPMVGPVAGTPRIAQADATMNETAASDEA